MDACGEGTRRVRLVRGGTRRVQLGTGGGGGRGLRRSRGSGGRLLDGAGCEGSTHRAPSCAPSWPGYRTLCSRAGSCWCEDAPPAVPPQCYIHTSATPERARTRFETSEPAPDRMLPRGEHAACAPSAGPSSACDPICAQHPEPLRECTSGCQIARRARVTRHGDGGRPGFQPTEPVQGTNESSLAHKSAWYILRLRWLAQRFLSVSAFLFFGVSPRRSNAASVWHGCVSAAPANDPSVNPNPPAPPSPEPKRRYVMPA